MDTVCKYIRDNYNYKENEIIFKFIEKDIIELTENTEYIYSVIKIYLCNFKLKEKKIIGKNLISFIYKGRHCDIMEYMNKYWIITIYPGII